VSHAVLWHIRISHYNEKVRWALELKRVPHARRAPMPGFHQVVARRLTGAMTLPVLVLDGEAIGDSTRIIAELERRYPDPPLYPEDPVERERALALEDHFDEHLGAGIRRLVFFHLVRDSELGPRTLSGPGGAVHARIMDAAWPAVRPIVSMTYGVSPDGAASGERAVRAALDRVVAELQPSGYLAGDRFSVADLTAAALLAPLTRPAGYPGAAAPMTAGIRPLFEELSVHPGAQWARDVYLRHRHAHALAATS
jgi:glutathione S-transferase